MLVFRVLCVSIEYLAHALLIAVAFGFYVASFNLHLIKNEMNISGVYLCPNLSMKVQIESSYALAASQD